MFFTAVDQDSRFVKSLERADITVYEDGVKQEILTFQHDTDRPLSIALLIDISGSEKLKLAEEKAAARGFIETEAAARMIQGLATTNQTDVETARQELINSLGGIPMNRPGTANCNQVAVLQGHAWVQRIPQFRIIARRGS